MTQFETTAALALLLAAAPQVAAYAEVSRADRSGSSIVTTVSAAAYANRSNERYVYNSGISGEVNAAAACFHAADKKVRGKRRGLFAKLDRVKKVKQKEKGGNLKVTLLVTNHYRTGTIRHWVKCIVDRDNVIFLKYN